MVETKELIKKILESKSYVIFWAISSILILHIGIHYEDKIMIMTSLVAAIKLMVLIIIRTIYFHNMDLSDLENNE